MGFLEDDPETRIDPMAQVFPRVTKCSFFKYGPSGTVQTHDAICVLPVNIVNEKLYIFLWFWLVSILKNFEALCHFFRETISPFFPLDNLGSLERLCNHVSHFPFDHSINGEDDSEVKELASKRPPIRRNGQTFRVGRLEIALHFES